MAKRKISYRDTMARCDEPSMLFDTVRNPHAPNKKPKGLSVSIEAGAGSMRQRINRDMDALVHADKPSLLKYFFLALSWLFRAAILAVAYPLYVCLFLVPRWFYVTVVEPVVQFIKPYLIRLQVFVQALAVKVSLFLRRWCWNLIGKPLNLISCRIKKGWALVYAKVQLVRLWMLRRWHTICKPVRVCIDYAKLIREKLIRRISQVATRSMKWIVSKCVPLFSFAHGGVQVKNWALQRLTAYFQRSIQLVRRGIAFCNRGFIIATYYPLAFAWSVIKEIGLLFLQNMRDVRISLPQRPQSTQRSQREVM